jgi:hypothetical protein
MKAKLVSNIMVKSEMPRRSLKYKAFIIILIVSVLAFVVWFFIVPHLTGYENLYLSGFRAWTINSEGEVRQATFVLGNKGTQDVTISNVWVNGTLLESKEWGSFFGRTIEPTYTRTLYAAPKEIVFRINATYNFTVDTSRGNHFPFFFEVDESQVKQENLTITNVYFNVWPPNWDYDIGVVAKNSGGALTIVTRVRVIDEMENNWTFETKQWFFPGESHAVVANVNWREGVTYYITIETIVGNTYETTSTSIESG